MIRCAQRYAWELRRSSRVYAFVASVATMAAQCIAVIERAGADSACISTFRVLFVIDDVLGRCIISDISASSAGASLPMDFRTRKNLSRLHRYLILCERAALYAERINYAFACSTTRDDTKKEWQEVDVQNADSARHVQTLAHMRIEITVSQSHPLIRPSTALSPRLLGSLRYFL